MEENQVVEFVLHVLRDQMNLTIDGSVTAESSFGSGGLNLESLAFVELSVQVENEFGVKFSDTEFEVVSRSTLGQFAQAVVSKRAGLAAAAGA
jgi:acyl carrier protein